MTTIISKECHNYKSILEECKEECINGGPKTNIMERTFEDQLEIESNALRRLRGEKMGYENHIVKKPNTENKISAERITFAGKKE
jgi:hypothetical protein